MTMTSADVVGWRVMQDHADPCKRTIVERYVTVHSKRATSAQADRH